MRVWLNHWFSTAYHLINLMKEDEQDFYFIGSSTNDLAIYKNSCDEWYKEETDIDADEYIKFALDFCIEHEIDIFVPRRFLLEIVQNHHRFNDIGVKLFTNEDVELIEILEDKKKTYDYFETIDKSLVPEIYIAKSYQEFLDYYDLLSQKYNKICYKLTIDEGARSFKIIDNEINEKTLLYEKLGYRINIEMTKSILMNYDFEIPVIVMPYLSGVEISVDCLYTKKGTIMLPRYKGKRYSEIVFDKKIMNQCEEIISHLQMKMPFNIQFKFEGDKPYLLEINPRMSGGLQLSCKATGINIPNIAINQLLGINKEWEYPNYKSKLVANIETPIFVD